VTIGCGSDIYSLDWWRVDGLFLTVDSGDVRADPSISNGHYSKIKN